MGMLYAAIDIHKHVFQAVTLDPSSGELVEARLPATREALAGWLAEWDGRLVAVAIEATCGWRWVARELRAAGVEVRLAEPAQTRALKGRRRQAKTDKLDARWLGPIVLPVLARPASAGTGRVHILGTGGHSRASATSSVALRHTSSER